MLHGLMPDQTQILLFAKEGEVDSSPAATHGALLKLPHHTAFTREHENDSPLFDYHFKRIMFDEGHFGAQGMASKTLKLAKRIVSESRWVITGSEWTCIAYHLLLR
jgi:hypothetical protein